MTKWISMGQATKTSGRRPPGPRSPLAALIAARDNRHLTFAQEAWHRYGDIVRCRFLLWPVTLLFHPDAVEHVLQKKHMNYDKDIAAFRAGKVAAGDGLFTSNGQLWLKQRRLMQPAFHRERIASLGTVMAEEAMNMVESWRHLPANKPIDIQEEMTKLTLRIAGRALFSTQLDGSEMDSFTRVLSAIVDYVGFPFPPLLVPTSRNRRLKAFIRHLDGVVYRLIANRRLSTNNESRDLLSLLLQARDEEGHGMSDKQLRDEVVTLLIGGFETTASMLSWTLYALNQHPAIEKNLHAELECVLGGRVPTASDLLHLPYTRKVLEEVLRLYPGLTLAGRRAICDDEINGFTIPAGSIVLIYPYLTHRHPAFWEDPESFDPERFSPEQSAQRPRFAYLPFSGGPRQCIGNSFTMVNAQIILATLVQRYQLRLAPGYVVEPVTSVLMHIKGGLPMTIHPR